MDVIVKWVDDVIVWDELVVGELVFVVISEVVIDTDV